MRHAWDKIERLRYRCRLCGLDKEHAQQPTEAPLPPRWVAVFLRDGIPIAHSRTPPCPGAPAAPPALAWTRVDRYCERADTGHMVAATYDGTAWRFSAFAPDVAPDVHWRDWPPLRSERFARGEHVPQRTPLLGVFGTADLARQACAEHAEILSRNQPATRQDPR
jgi:hypothetical protein